MSQIQLHFQRYLRQGLKHSVFFLCLVLYLSESNAQSVKSERILAEMKLLKNQKNFSKKDTVFINRVNELAVATRYYSSDSLLLLCKQAIAYSRTSEYVKGEIKGLVNLGTYYSDKGDIDNAILNFKKAFDLTKDINDSKLSLIAQNFLSGEYAYKGDYENALKGYLEGIEMAETTGNLKMLTILNENIATLYISQKDYEQALEYYKKVKKVDNQIGDEILSAKTASNMASLYTDMGKLDYAMFNANSSISVFEKNKLLDWIAYAYEVKGKIYLHQNKYDWALFWYQQSETIHNKLEDPRAKIDLLSGMADAHFGLEKDSISLQYALSAYNLAEAIHSIGGKQKSSKTLYKLSKRSGKNKEALAYHEIYQSLTDSLALIANQQSLTLLKTNLQHDKQKQILILENEKQLARQRNYVYAAVAILLLFIVITCLVKRNEKIQKRLNEQLKTQTEGLVGQEKKLKEINDTKDKLFSIVAHDLRGPIGAFQGLLKLFNQGEIGREEFIEFIPKLGNDIDHISFTLNNLLSWGQNQMNGLVTKPDVICLGNLVRENINLLRESATSKSIKLSSNLSRKTLSWSDGDQMDIVIRNLISNAIKFTPTNGMITIASREMNKHWEISVRDSGIGIDKETVETLFSDESNKSTYGTNNEKGTGLGLTLCKEMVEKNEGTIWVDSHVGRGTTFYFTVPKAKRSERYIGVGLN